MKKFLDTLRRSWILSSVLTILLGLVLLIEPDTTSRILCYCVGGVLTAHGILYLIRYFSEGMGSFFLRYELVVGIILCGAGIFLLTRPEFVVMMLPMILGIYIMVDGAVNAGRALEMRKLNFPKWWAAFAASAFLVMFGAVMFWNPFEAAQMTAMFIGGVLLYQGISDFMIPFVLGRGKKKLEKLMRFED